MKALARPAAAQWRLTVFGAGPQRARLERLSARLGLSDRISFRGARPRAEVLAALADADAMLFPSIHDAAGWSVAEAVAEGCPVVGLALGGPVTLTTAADAVLVPPRGDVVGGLAAALGRVHELSPAGGRWAASRLPGFLRTVYQRAAHLPAQHAGRER